MRFYNKKVFSIILLFLGINFGIVLLQKLIGSRGRGVILPTGSLTWAEIWANLPWYAFVSALWTLSIFLVFNRIRKDIIKIEKEKKMWKENTVKFYSQPYSHECRVCGYHTEEYPWGEDGKSPKYQICPCCGVQFGKEDIDLESIRTYRQKWQKKGGKWFQKKEKPNDWNMDEQMGNIPEEFR